jgi:acyl-CoA reductase-like NAD-dependent aldehyde dehydrogenase
MLRDLRDLRDLRGTRSVGVISEEARGIVEIARPVGVVCAITPSTNPVRDAGEQDRQRARCRTAVIAAPSPKGSSTCARLTAVTHQIGSDACHMPSLKRDSRPVLGGRCRLPGLLPNA